MSNHPSNLDKGTKSLTYLVYILKICYLRSAIFALDFLGRRDSKAQKKIYINCLRKRLESYLASTASTTSGNINHHYLIRKRLEFYLPSNHCQNLGTQLCVNQQQGSRSNSTTTTFNLFTNVSDIPEVIALPTKTPITGYFLRHEYCHYLKIKVLISVSQNLCKYTWKIVICMVLTSKRYLGPDI